MRAVVCYLLLRHGRRLSRQRELWGLSIGWEGAGVVVQRTSWRGHGVRGVCHELCGWIDNCQIINYISDKTRRHTGMG